MKNLAHQANRPRGILRARVVLQALKGLPGILVGLLLLVWLVPPLLSEESGFRFGMGYRVFFTVVLFLGAVFFWFLGKERISSPRSTAGVLGSLAAVFVLTVGVLVVAGVVYPQFELPRPPGAAAQEAVERGEELFRNATPPCIQCHIISGRGGTRGPDLTHVAARAGERVSGLTAEQYLLEKVSAGGTYRFTVPEYVPMMPQFSTLLTQEQLEDLVAYLLSLE